MRYLNHAAKRTFAVAIVVVATGFGAGIATAAQPDMDGALQGLQVAQDHLNRVTQDKAGHANAARKLISQAIDEVQKGIAYGDTQGE